MAERPSVKGAIAKQLDPDGLSVISNCLAIRIIAHYPIPHLLVYLGKKHYSLNYAIRMLYNWYKDSSNMIIYQGTIQRRRHQQCHCR